MNHELLAIPEQECQENNQLEAYADQVAAEVFTSLYLTDLFILDQLKDNKAAYDAMIYELIEKWQIPDETQRMVEYDIELYCPYGEEEDL